MRELLITKTVGTIQAYTNQGAPVKVCSLISLRFNTQHELYMIPSPVPRQVQCEQFHQKDGLHIHTVASVCMCCIL